jgi:3-methyladenine DNA glycosylase AlkD
MKNSFQSNTAKDIRAVLYSQVRVPSHQVSRFFKTHVGGYAEGDQFIGVMVPNLRKIAKGFGHIGIPEIQELLSSAVNEERLLALLILVRQYEKASDTFKEEIYQFYLDNLKFINNWNLVDSSAHWIIGAHLVDRDKTILLDLAQSSTIWERRIAIVATWYLIRKENFEWTLRIAQMLLHDKHDLIHKAVGWMLREVGKRDAVTLTSFLDRHAVLMPRTMLRYAIEKMPADQRKAYLLKQPSSITATHQ